MANCEQQGTFDSGQSNKILLEPTNGNVLGCCSPDKSVEENVSILRENFSAEGLRLCRTKSLHSKLSRLRKTVKELKRNKKHSELDVLLKEEFCFPTRKNINENQQVREKTEQVVLENRAMKRQILDHIDENENLSLQISHYETKVNIFLQLLDIAVSKQREVAKSSGSVQVLKRKCTQWEKKYNELEGKLEKTLEILEEKKSRLQRSNIRNVNKKLKRRYQKIKSQEEQIAGQMDENAGLAERNTELMVENEELMTSDEKNMEKITDLKKDKRALQIKVLRLVRKTNNCELVEINDSEIEKLKSEVKEKEQRISELEQLNAILDDSIVESFQEGKYVNEVRQTVMSLVTECGVSLKKVNKVMETVLSNLAGKSLSMLPSTGVLSRLYVEAKRVAQCQVVEAMLDGEGGNPMSFQGNCLHQDGTSKFHRHFQGFQVTTCEKETLSIGLSEVGGADAVTLMETFRDNISQLSEAISTMRDGDSVTVQKLVTSIVSTMSDQGSTNHVFNSQFTEFRQDVLPGVVDNWENLNLDVQSELGGLASFFCKMHIFVNMASEGDKCLSLFEKGISEGRNPFAFEWSESGASRLTRTVSKAFTDRGCEKSGVGSHFATYLKETGATNKLITFRGHRFNHLFYAAGATYYHVKDISEFLTKWSDPNDLLKSVQFDVKEIAYLSGIRALGMIDKLVTGPFWRLIEGAANVVALNEDLLQLKITLERWSKDASPLMSAEPVFSPEKVSVHKDEIYEALFAPCDDPVMDTYTQMALELVLGGMLLILERQAKDQLPGGKFWNAPDADVSRASSVPCTNTASERDFAQLDFLMRTKPSASTIAYESVIMWSNNKTSTWLNSLSETERKKVLDDARTAAPCMMACFRERQRVIFNKKLENLHKRQEKKSKQEEKSYTNKVKLTGKLSEIGGLWLSDEDIHNYKEKVSANSEKEKEAVIKESIITQLQFRKQVIQSKGPKELFQQSSKGKTYSAQQLENNLKQVLQINRDSEIEKEEPKLLYKSSEQVSQTMSQVKQSLSNKIEAGRKKILLSQQEHLLPTFIENPDLLVGKRVKHKCRDPTSGDTEWCSGTVVLIKRSANIKKKTEYEIKYDDVEDGDDGLWFFPLLLDMERGDIIIME